MKSKEIARCLFFSTWKRQTVTGPTCLPLRLRLRAGRHSTSAGRSLIQRVSFVALVKVKTSHITGARGAGTPVLPAPKWYQLSQSCSKSSLFSTVFEIWNMFPLEPVSQKVAGHPSKGYII